LILSGSEGRTGYPQVKISVNNKVYYNDVVKGQQEIQFTVNELNTRNILSIEMVDKSPKDTVVHQDKIIKDKTLKIVQVLLDKIDIKNYIYTGRQKPIYHYENQGPKITIGDHLFFNGAWKLYYKNPVRLFLAQYHGRGQMINTPEKQSIKLTHKPQIKFYQQCTCFYVRLKG